MDGLGRIRGVWKGRTIACIASGPSLREEDCERVREAGVPTIVANNSFRLAPWAEAIFAMDAMWWAEYAEELLRSGFRGMKFGAGPSSLGVVPTKGKLYPPGFGNSGSYAASLGIISGASRIVLLGYDCQLTGGRKHFHEDHPTPMGNATSIRRWPYHFALVAKYAESHGCRITNCSRETALHCFERRALEEVEWGEERITRGSAAVPA